MLRLDQLQVGHPGHSCVRELSLTIPAGQLVVLLGANGVGKTTLLRTIGGLTPALAGTVYLQEHSLTELASRERARLLGMALAQGDAAFGGTVHEMIQLGRHPYQRRFAPDPREQAWVEQAAAQLQISAWLNRPMRTLSSGMQQRVHLARLWVQQTPLLLLDEPLAHLDWPARYFVMEWLQQLAQRENRTILVSAHDVGLALRYADTALLLLGQNRWAWGSPEQLGAEGHLTDLYGAEGLSYDPEAQDLRPVQSDRPAVQVWAPDNLRPWLCHAAERCGWRVEPAAEVQLHAQDAGFQMVFPDGRTQQVRGWSQLADLLRQAGPRV